MKHIKTFEAFEINESLNNGDPVYILNSKNSSIGGSSFHFVDADGARKLLASYPEFFKSPGVEQLLNKIVKEYAEWYKLSQDWQNKAKENKEQFSKLLKAEFGTDNLHQIK